MSIGFDLLGAMVMALRIFAVLLFAVLLPGCGGQTPRSMDAMRGGCGDYRLDLGQEFAIAQEPGERVSVYSRATDNAATVPMRKKLLVELFPTNSVVFVVEPERRGKKPEEHAGLVRLVVPEDGMYRISTGSAIWVELVSWDGKRVRSPKFEMQSQCERVFKVAAFPLKANTSYWLQMSASRTPATHIIVTPDR
jgi:hypothetical protein